MQRVLQLIATLCWRHSSLVLALSLVVTLALATVAALTLRLETDLAELMPARSRAAEDLQEYLERFGAGDRVYLMIGPLVEESPVGNEDLLISFADRLRTHLERSAMFLELDTGPGDTFPLEAVRHFFLHAFQILPPETGRLLLPELEPDRVDHAINRVRARLEGASPALLKELVRVDPLDLGGALNRIEARQITSERASLHGGLSVDAAQGYLFSADTTRLLMVGHPTAGVLDTAFAGELMETVARVVETVRRELAAEEAEEQYLHLPVLVGGGYLFSLEDEANTKRDVKVTLLGSLVAVLLLMAIAFGRPRLILAMSLPLVAGAVWTLAFTGLALGRLNMISLAFGAILFGLGMDFTIHLLNHFFDRYAETPDPSQALMESLQSCGRSIVGSSLTTAAAFYALSVCGFPGLRELGIITGTGVLATMVAVLFLIPALLARAAERSRSKGRTLSPWIPRRRPAFGTRALARLVTEHPGGVLAVCAVVTAVLFLLPGSVPEVDLDLRNLRPPDSNADSVQQQFEDVFGRGLGEPLTVLFRGDNLQELLERSEALAHILTEERARVGEVLLDSPSSWLPSYARQQRNLAVLDGIDLEETCRALEDAADRHGFSTVAFMPFLEALRDWDSGEPNWIGRDSLPPTLAGLLGRRYLSGPDADGSISLAVRLFSPEGRWDDAVLADLRVLVDRAADVSSNHDSGDTVSVPAVASLSMLMADFKSVIGRRFGDSLLLSLILVVIILLFQFRRIIPVILTLLPLFVALIWTYGLMRLAGGSVQFVSAMALPLIVGIGIDDGIHMVNRIRNRRPGQPAAGPVAELGRSVFLTTLTTVAGFGSLALARMPGLSGLGRLAIVGVLLCLVATLVVLPAVSVLAGRWWRGGPSV